jgi:hypothetical protein
MIRLESVVGFHLSHKDSRSRDNDERVGRLALCDTQGHAGHPEYSDGAVGAGPGPLPAIKLLDGRHVGLWPGIWR